VLALIAGCFLSGGGARVDIRGLILLYPLAILIGTVLLVLPGERRWMAVRTPMLLLAAWACLMAVQLVPLPPALWDALPGHGQFKPFMEAADVSSAWRTLSLTPDLTLASLVGLSVPAAALIGMASLSEEQAQRLLPYILIASVLSALAGLGQLAGGPNSAFYGYEITNKGSAVGLFSNRNHQALFIAMTCPMLAVWVTQQGLDPRQVRLRRWIGGAAAVAIVPMVTITGSRAGLFLALAGAGFAWWLVRAELRRKPHGSEAKARWQRAWPVLLLLAAIATVVLSSRDEALQRLFETSLKQEDRMTQLPVLLHMARDFLPFGSGVGSFDPLYRYYEPNTLLEPAYLNHAHNDVLEAVITGGLPAAAVALLLLGWSCRQAMRLVRAKRNPARERYAWLGLAMIVLALLASLVDYPLRTPIHAMLFAFSCSWLAALRPNSARGAAEA
jgi:O-antigen ligase